MLEPVALFSPCNVHVTARANCKDGAGAYVLSKLCRGRPLRADDGTRLHKNREDPKAHVAFTCNCLAVRDIAVPALLNRIPHALVGCISLVRDNVAQSRRRTQGDAGRRPGQTET